MSEAKNEISSHQEGTSSNKGAAEGRTLIKNIDSGHPGQKTEMEFVPCNLCGQEEWDEVLVAQDLLYGREGDFTLVRCKNCSLTFLNPRPKKEHLAYFYPSEYRPHQSPKPKKRRNFLETRWRVVQERLRTLVLREFYGYPGLEPEKKNLAFRLLLKILLFPYYLWHKKHIGTLPYRGEGKVLDIGCGAGRHLARLKKYGWDAYGIDISERVAQMARDQFGLEVVQGDILEHQFPEEAFDIVTMWFSLEHMPEPRQVLLEVNRILKPGGLLIISIPNIDGWLAKRLRERWYSLQLPTHLYLFTPGTTKKMLAAAGFRVVKIRHIKSSLRRTLARLDKDKHRILVRLAKAKHLVGLVNFFQVLLRISDNIEVHAEKNNTLSERLTKEMVGN